ncbi:MAG TPA: VOC family protein [Chthoniobacteraceae bacterium]|nr:VOC family protein [Chthoniobacteraceae bacterium]
MIRKLAHLCFVTDDLDRMLHFYSKQIGLPVKFSFKNAGGEIFGYYLECGDSSFVEIFDRKLKFKQWGGELEQPAKGTMYNHFCMEVTGLPAFKATLESRGVKMTEIKTGMDHSLQSWTNDPDGNPIEFMEYTGESLQIQREIQAVNPDTVAT